MLIITLPTLIAAGSVAVDLSAQKLARTQLQAVTDIAALAGTSRLDGTEEGLLAARAAAARAAGRNVVAGRAVAIDEDDMLVGSWDSTSGELETDVVVEEMDSIKVKARRDDLETGFARLAFGREHMGVLGRSTGFNPPDDPASSVGCYLPLAIPACLFDHYDMEQLASLELVLNPAGVDTAGWGRVGASPSSSWVRAQIWDCEQDGVINVGDEVGLQAGVVTPGLEEFLEAIESSWTTWNSDEWGPLPSAMADSAVPAAVYGRTVEGAIIVFDGGSDYCEGGGGSYSGYEALVGFAWGVIYDVRTAGGAADKNLRLKLDTNVDHAVGLRGGGGIFTGVTYPTPGVLVQ